MPMEEVEAPLKWVEIAQNTEVVKISNILDGPNGPVFQYSGSVANALKRCAERHNETPSKVWQWNHVIIIPVSKDGLEFWRRSQ